MSRVLFSAYLHPDERRKLDECTAHNHSPSIDAIQAELAGLRVKAALERYVNAAREQKARFPIQGNSTLDRSSDVAKALLTALSVASTIALIRPP